MGRTVASSRSLEAGVVVGGLVLVVALVVVTAGGPVDYVSAPPAPTGRPTQLARPPATYTPPPVLPGWEAQPTGPPAWVDALMQVIFLLVAMAAAYLLFRFGRHVLDLAGRRPVRVRLPEPRSATPLPEVPEELVGAAAIERRERLAAGEPRNAIVAMWLDLQEATAGSGLARRQAETPGEYVARVMSTWDVDVRALADLAELYREARFSSHPIGPDHRDRALRHLDRVHADLAAAQAGAR